MSKQQRDLSKEARWRKVIDEHSSSGLSARAFCQQAGLSEYSFYAWRRTIRERDGQAASQSTFVSARVIDEPASEGSIDIALAQGFVMHLPISTSVTKLADLVHALQSRGVR